MRKSAYGWNLGGNEKSAFFWTNQNTPLLSIVGLFEIWDGKRQKSTIFHSIRKL